MPERDGRALPRSGRVLQERRKDAAMGRSAAMLGRMIEEQKLGQKALRMMRTKWRHGQYRVEPEQRGYYERLVGDLRSRYAKVMDDIMETDTEQAIKRGVIRHGEYDSNADPRVWKKLLREGTEDGRRWLDVVSEDDPKLRSLLDEYERNYENPEVQLMGVEPRKYRRPGMETSPSGEVVV